MIAPQLVEAPIIFPGQCFVCGNQKGPILDMHQETAGLRLYLCKRCAKAAAREYGFAKGSKLDELEEAGVRVEQAEKEAADAQAATWAAREEIAKQDAAIVDLLARLEEANAKLQTYEAIAGHVAEATAELVTGPHS